MDQDGKHPNETPRLDGTHKERKRNELENAGHEMDDETFSTHVMASLPQEEYQATILTLKAKLKEDDPMIEEAETLLDDNYKTMKEVQGWTEDGDELALLVGKPHYKKTFKGQCGYSVEKPLLMIGLTSSL